MKNNESERRTFEKGEVIFRQGDRACFMCDILSGSVGIYAALGSEQEEKLAQLGAGDYFGEMGLLDSVPRSASAVALEDGTRVQIITAENFDDYFHRNTEHVFAIMRHMSGRLRELSRNYLEVCRAAAESRDGKARGVPKSGALLAQLKKYRDVYLRCVGTGQREDRPGRRAHQDP